jgi:very-short-patch-repair endonuclease
MTLANLPQHPAIRLAVVEMDKSSAENSDDDADAPEEPLLRVARPRLTDAPPLPQILDAWMVSSGVDPAVSPIHRELITHAAKSLEEPPRVERFDEVSTRVTALANWRLTWDSWAAAEGPARKAMQVFEALYALLGRIERDSERIELVLGDGRLRRHSTAGSIDHPVLLQRVELEFDVTVPEFRVIDADRGPELYAPILVGDDAISGEKLSALQQELEEAGFHPLSEDGTTGFLRRLTALLGPSAVYSEHGNERVLEGAPTIRRDPVLFLRVRASGMSAAFERVLDDLEKRASLPVSLSRLVGVEPLASQGAPEEGVDSAWGEPIDVLLSKPANREQIQIARALAKHGAVLVQGPPGTGKSHTIANLVGHLVAQGKRVLVTSHTTKALRVLREQIVEELRPLCVALLEQDLEGRTQLEGAVRGIVERLTGAQEPQLIRDIASLTKARSDLIALIGKCEQELRVAREGEYIPIDATIGSESWSPVDAARAVARDREECKWLPGPLSPHASLPLSDEELSELYRTNVELTFEEEEELAAPLPDTEKLMSVDAMTFSTEALRHGDSPKFASFWQRSALSEDVVEIEFLDRSLGEFVRELQTMAPWQLALVEGGRDNEIERSIWLKLRDLARDTATQYLKARSILVERDVSINNVLGTSEDLTTAKQILDYLRRGSSLNAFTLLVHRSWRKLVRECSVDGHAPSSREEFEALVAFLETVESRKVLAKRWGRQAVPIGLPDVSDLPEPRETALREYVDQFEKLLDWWKSRWPSLNGQMTAAGLDWISLRNHAAGQLAPASSFDRDLNVLEGVVMSAVAARVSGARYAAAIETLARVDVLLSSYSGKVSGAMRRAVRACDVEAYNDALDALRAIAGKQGTRSRRLELLQRLTTCAPEWAREIQLRTHPHGYSTSPGNAIESWAWRQLEQELERRSAINEREVTNRLQQRQVELREVTTRLIDSKSWLAQLRRTDLGSRQALIGWADTQKKIGKGTGKRVPELRAKARKQLGLARDSVPVWIMPLSRVAESFDPTKGRFDVVIVDEASQSDVTGLLAFYAGDSVVVVGDNEQVSPSAVGQAIVETKALIAQHLGGIPNDHLYDGQTSIYDLASQSFGGVIALAEHFRCVPDIIDFSNFLSYSGKIRPLRDPATAIAPHVAEFCLPPTFDAEGTGRTFTKINGVEARWIAALLKAIIDMPEFARKSVGAISLVGDEQGFEIQKYLLDLVGAVELQRRRFAAGNAAQFQGDERDIIFLSMVDRPVGRMLPRREQPMFKQRYNVAASRARDQLWLVHSLDPNRDLQPTDLRRRLIDHVRAPAAMRDAMNLATRRAESPFERLVIEGLLAAGFIVRPQVEVGRYRIDMVVSDGARQIALECDGDRFHPIDKIPDDLARQAVLERAGWRFVRIRGTRFFRDPATTLQEVILEIEKLGVRRDAVVAPDQAREAGGSELRDEIVRRATNTMLEKGWLPNIASGDAVLPSPLSPTFDPLLS